MAAKLEDSNIANYGGDGHRDLRKEAAESEEAFRGAGQREGVEVWRIEQLRVVRWPQKMYGTFYSGDSYIVLFTYKQAGSQKLLYNLHFWLGLSTTQDEYGCAAIKTVELDDLLNDLPVQYREVQGYESKEFRRLFPRMRLLDGGVDSGFNHVKPEEYAPRLLHVKGKEYVQVVQVPLRARSLNEGDCFVLDAGLRLYQWNGASSNHHERRRAGEVVRETQEARMGKPETIIVDGLEDEDTFWDLLGGKPAALRPATPDDIEPPTRCIYRLSDASGEMRFEQVAEGTDEFERSVLDSNDAFIVDAGHTVYAFVGRGASGEERKQAIRYGMKYLDDHDRPLVTPVVRVIEGGEPLAFQKLFDEPPPAAARGPEESKHDGGGKGKGKGGGGGFEGLLTVTCHEARGLRKVQLLGKQDPYLTVRLGKQRHRTRTHEDGGEAATWGETFKLEISPKDKDLRVTVSNANIVIDSAIGEVRVPLGEVIERASHADRWVPVCTKTGEPAGEVRLTVVYTPAYVVRVARAEGLKSTQMIGKMDTYIKVMRGDKDKNKRRSKVVQNGDKDPVFEDEHEANFSYNLGVFAPTEVLTMQVWNENPVSDDMVGSTGANVGNLIKAANQGPLSLPLVTKSGKPCGTLHLRVTQK